MVRFIEHLCSVLLFVVFSVCSFIVLYCLFYPIEIQLQRPGLWLLLLHLGCSSEVTNCHISIRKKNNSLCVSECVYIASTSRFGLHILSKLTVCNRVDSCVCKIYIARRRVELEFCTRKFTVKKHD